MQLRGFVDGEFIPVSLGSATPVKDAERALAAAKRVHDGGTWWKLSAQSRCDILAKVCERLDEAVVESMAKADAAETGVPISVTRMINSSLKDSFSVDALKPLCDAASPKSLRTAHGPLRLLRRPHGPALILAPWNVPSGTVVGKLIAALVAGCPVIVKPSEIAQTGLEIFLNAVQGAGLPPGVLQWLHGGPELGSLLVSDSRTSVVHFTGSSAVGQQVAKVCAERLVPFLMECGGSNVAIVLDNADVSASAQAIANGVTQLNGQWCAGVSRIFVHGKLLEALVDAILAEFESLHVGAADDAGTDFGPLSHRAHHDRMEAEVAKLRAQGGTVRRSTLLCEKESVPCLFSPTLVTGLALSHQVYEIFGPIATVQGFNELTEAIEASNQRSMLQSYIFSSDVDGALSLGSELICGSVMINAIDFGFHGVALEDGQPCEPTLTFFGASGFGTEAGAADAVQFFAGAQSVGVNK